MKSVTIKGTDGKPILKVSHKGGEYLLEKWTSARFTVLIIGHDKTRTVLGDTIKNNSVKDGK